MKYFYILLAVLGLGLMLLATLLHLYESMDAEQMKMYMFIGTVLWFSGAIPWLGKKKIQN